MKLVFSDIAFVRFRAFEKTSMISDHETIMYSNSIEFEPGKSVRELTLFLFYLIARVGVNIFWPQYINIFSKK